MKIFELLFSVNSSQLDKPAKQLDKIGDEAKEAKREVNGLGDALDAFSGLDGPIGNVAGQIKNLRENANTALGGIQALTSGLGGVAASVGLVTGAVLGLAGAGGIVAAFNFAGPLDDIGDLAAKLGLSADQASILGDRLAAAGTSIDVYFNSIDKVSKALTKADEEGSKANEALGKLNINVKDGADPIKTLNTLVDEYSDKLEKGKVSADELASLQLVLGKNYREVIVANKEARDAQEEVNRLYEMGIGISQQGSEAAGEFEKAQLGISHIFKVVGSQLVRDILPTFTALINQFRESYEQGGLVKQIFSGIALAADVLMIPIKVLINGFIVLETTIMAVGKGLAGVFAAIATRSLDPLKEMNAEVEKLWMNAADKVEKIDLFGQRNNSDTVAAPRSIEVGSSAPSKPKDKEDTKDKTSAVDPFYVSMQGVTDLAKVEQYRRQIEQRDAAAAERETQRLLGLKARYTELLDPLNKYTKMLDEVRLLREKGLITAEQQLDMELEIETQRQKALEGTKKQHEETFDIMQRVGMTAFQGLEDAIVSLATKGKFSFKAFAQSILQDLIRITAQLYIIKPLMAYLGFPVASAKGNVISNGSVVPSAKGNVFSNGGVTAFANGGVVSQPTFFPMRRGTGLMGEAGPEGILPLKRNSSGQLGVIASGMGGTTNNQFNINVTVQGGQTNEETGAVTARAVRQEAERIAQKVYSENRKRERLAVA